MAENKTKLDEIYMQSKITLEGNGFIVSDFKPIDYGVQFQVSKASKKGAVRIYANKKGDVKYDFSQLREEDLKNEVQTLVTGISAPHRTKAEKNYYDSNAPFVPVIGTDESGKGDYFGPLVSAGVFVNLRTKPMLEKLGVRDSKKLGDNQIKSIARSIKEVCANEYAVIEISPETYNSLFKQFKNEGKNLNVLLAWAHAKAIEEVLTKVDCENALADKFADEKFIIGKLQEKGKKIVLRQEHKAEGNIAVAAASILARDRFLEKLRKLSADLGIDLPKGASSVVIEQAKKVVEKYGEETLSKIAKLHFKTTEAVIPSD